MATVPEEVHQIIKAKFRILDLVTAECSSRELTFLLLEGKDSLLDSVLDGQLVYVYLTRLSETMGTVESLVLKTRLTDKEHDRCLNRVSYLKCRVPPHVDQDDIIAGSEIQA